MRYIVASIQVVLSLVTAMATEAEDGPEAATRKVQQAQENVFLGDWLLLGPFPANSTDVEAPTIESVSRAAGRGEPLPHDDQSQDWIPWPHRVIDFRSALDANGDQGENVIAYAVTRFHVDRARSAVLSLSYGVPSAKPRLFPVIEADGFVTNDTFGFDLAPEGPTEVTWELPKATVIVGTVTDAVTGRGVGGVTLASGRDRFASNRKNPQTKTNPDGSFQLKGVPEGGVLVHAFSDHHSPQMKSVTATLQEPTEVNFEIAAGRPVAGTVKDPKGKPLAGVWLVTDTWDGVRMFRRETRSDAQGRFTLSHMPDTPAEVHVLLQNYVSKRDLTVVGGDIVDLTLRPIIEHTVRILTQEQKEPVPDLKIQKGYLWAGRSEVSWDGRDYQSDRYYDKATGVFRIRNGETPSGAQISYRFRSVGYEDVVLEVPDPDEGPQSIDIAMKPVGLIHGTIVDAETGQAMPDVAVAVLTKEDRLRADMYINFRPAYLALERFTGTQVVSEEDGRFQLPKQSDWEGVSLVLLSRDGGFHFIEDARAVLQHSAEPRLPMPAAGSVEGTVTEAGQGVAGESIRVSWQGPGAEPRWDLPFGVGGKVDTDHDGKFAFATLGPGRYKIYRVRSFESESSSGSISMYMSGEDLVVMPGQTTTHNLDRPAGLRAVGQTLDADGKAVPGCVVTVRPADDVLARIDAVRSDASGHFEFANLQPGEYTFDATMYQRSAVNTCGLGNEQMRGSETVSFDADATFSLEMSEISAPSLPESLTGTIAPSFSATPIDHDSPFSTADAWGKVVAIDFWATWCGPCMAVMPQLKELYEKHKNDPDFVLITVSLDQDEDQLHKVIKDRELEFPVVWQGDGWQDGLAKQFGVSSIPASFVIGRDGTFASDRIHGSKLAAAVEDALKRELDPAIRDQPPARLTIRATLDGQADGVPGLRLSLKAINAEGKTIRENHMNMPGPTVQTQWRYPGLTDGGTMVVTASIPGADEQQRELADPSAKETIEFDFDSPQVLRGRLTQQGEPLSVPGVKITVHENGGFTRETTTDDEGRFEVGCIAGRYSAQATSDKYVQVPTRVKPIVIQSDRPSQPVSIDMCQAKTLVGMVLAPDGAPADRAKVRLIQGEPVSTDEQGRFSLPGVPSVGKVTIYAGSDDGAGKLDVEDFDGQGGTTIALTAPGGRGGLAVGSKVPPWNVTDLDSNPVDWGAQGGNRLIVFAPLWHPEGRRLVKKAAQFGRESKTPVVLVSLDWTREAAKRHLDELSFDGQVLFAGGGGLGLDPEWKIGQSPQAILVSPRSTVLANPLAD